MSILLWARMDSTSAFEIYLSILAYMNYYRLSFKQSWTLSNIKDIVASDKDLPKLPSILSIHYLLGIS